MSARRTLLVSERVVPASEREHYVESLRETQARCEAVGVRFWAFEHERDGSRYMEFAEAKDETMLDESGIAALGLGALATSRWHAVELE